MTFIILELNQDFVDLTCLPDISLYFQLKDIFLNGVGGGDSDLRGFEKNWWNQDNKNE